MKPLLTEIGNALRSALRIRTALALTIRPTANSLLGTVPRREKEALAVKTTAGLVHVDSAGFE